MTFTVRLPFCFSLLLALALAIESPAFGQTAVVSEVRVLELSRADLDQLVSSTPKPGFAKALSKEMADALANGPRSKTVHRLELKATNGTSTQLRLDSRIPASSGSSVDVQTYFDIGIGIDVNPKVFLNRDIELSTASHVRIRQSLDGDIAQAAIFENASANFETRIHEGETIVLGGFITDAERMSFPSLPTLPDNPILNYFYSKTRGQQDRKEIVVLLTPRIVGAIINAAVDAPVSVNKPAVVNPPSVASAPAPVPAPAIVNPPAAVNTASAKETRTLYTVQVGAFDTQAKAESLVARLKGKYAVFVDKVSSKTPYHVRVGRLPDMGAAKELQRQLARDGFDTYLTTLE